MGCTPYKRYQLPDGGALSVKYEAECRAHNGLKIVVHGLEVEIKRLESDLEDADKVNDQLNGKIEKLKQQSKPESSTGDYGYDIVLGEWIEKITGKQLSSYASKLTKEAIKALEIKPTAKAKKNSRYLPDVDKAQILDWIKDNWVK